MDEVIARWKAADKLDKEETHAEGKDAGESWAKRARPRQLRELQALANDPHGIAGNIETFASGTNAGIALGLFNILNPSQQDTADKIDVEEFWSQAVGDNGAEQIEDTDFALGFCEGALDLWTKHGHKV